jgi:formylglycine-generating enzyme required for sulfatase activity
MTRVGPHYLARITPVGIYPPGPLDVFDLSGNASEWCLTTWDGNRLFR